MSVIDAKTAEAAGGLVSAVLIAAGASAFAPIAGALVPLAIKLADRLCDAGYEVPDVAELRAKAKAMAELPDL